MIVLSKKEMKNVTGGTKRMCDVYYIKGGKRELIERFDEDAPGANSAHDEATFWAMSTGRRVGYDCEGV